MGLFMPLYTKRELLEKKLCCRIHYFQCLKKKSTQNFLRLGHLSYIYKQLCLMERTIKGVPARTTTKNQTCFELKIHHNSLALWWVNCCRKCIVMNTVIRLLLSKITCQFYLVRWLFQCFSWGSWKYSYTLLHISGFYCSFNVSSYTLDFA